MCASLAVAGRADEAEIARRARVYYNRKRPLALLAGLRSGKLEEAVTKMEADEAAAEAQAAASAAEEAAASAEP